jgi:hypothetical protein
VHLATLHRSAAADSLLRDQHYPLHVMDAATLQVVAATCAVPLPRLHPLGNAWTAHSRCIRSATVARGDLHPWHQPGVFTPLI